MSVFSSNRISSIAESGFVPNMNYDICDFGRVLYESMVNDAAIFKAIIVSDIREAVAIREGTMIMAEADEATKENKKKLGEIIKASLTKFIEKIQGILAKAKRKIQIICANNGKKFDNKEFMDKMSKKIGEDGSGLRGFEFKPVEILTHENMMVLKNDIEGYFKLINTKFTDRNDSNATNGKRDFMEGIELTKIDKINSIKDITSLVKTIVDANTIISLIDGLEKTSITVIKKYMSSIDKKSESIDDLRNEANEYQKDIVNVSSSVINILLKMIKNSCGVLNAAASYSAENASCILYMEAAVAESDAEIDAVIDNPNPEEDSDDNEININININKD